MIPLELNQYKNDPVINQHIMRMIDTNIFWYGKTFRAIFNGALEDLKWRINCETPRRTQKRRDSLLRQQSCNIQ